MTTRKARTLDGQVALVTGGGKGIGRAVALALSARGVRVVVTGPEERPLGEVVGEIANAGGKARHVVGDVRDPKHLDAAVERAISVFGRLDIAIANAGRASGAVLGAANADDARAAALQALETNLLGAYATLDAAARKMANPGRLIAVCRTPGATAESASYAGVVGLVRAAARELGARGITANVIAVGDGAETPEPERIAELAVFLCGSAADGITGQAIAVRGDATTFGG